MGSKLFSVMLIRSNMFCLKARLLKIFRICYLLSYPLININDDFKYGSNTEVPHKYGRYQGTYERLQPSKSIERVVIMPSNFKCCMSVRSYFCNALNRFCDIYNSKIWTKIFKATFLRNIWSLLLNHQISLANKSLGPQISGYI